jgi:hypothetical protein
VSCFSCSSLFFIYLITQSSSIQQYQVKSNRQHSAQAVIAAARSRRRALHARKTPHSGVQPGLVHQHTNTTPVGLNHHTAVNSKSRSQRAGGDWDCGKPWRIPLSHLGTIPSLELRNPGPRGPVLLPKYPTKIHHNKYLLSAQTTLPSRVIDGLARKNYIRESFGF